jgi:2-oxoisovalerate dehydrogenase E1 component
MPKTTDVRPEFRKGELCFPGIPLFRYEGALKQEIDKGYSREDALWHFRLMLLVRQFEQLIVDMKAGKFVPLEGFSFIGATHLSLGQEAVAVGAISAIGPEDYITSTHRGHGHSIVKTALALMAKPDKALETLLEDARPFLFEGAALRDKILNLHLFRTMAELFGKEEGYCRGRGGGMHIADFNSGHLGANAIVGGSYGIAVGAALGSKLRKDGRVVLCLMGDGATNNGICHEAYNFATQKQFQDGGVPVIFLIENNQYGMTGQQKGEVTGVEYLSQRAAGYNEVNMNAEVVDGMDLLAVRDAVRRGAEICRDGKGPVVIECETYRWMGHSLSDLCTAYRSKDEEEAWKAKDPVKGFACQLVEAGILGEKEVASLIEEARGRIENAARLAARATDPDPASISEGLFSRTVSETVEPPWDRVTTLSPPRRYQRDGEGRILMRHAIAEALTEEMLRDKRVILYGEDVADYGGAFQVTSGLLNIFGRERVFNAPISEACIAGSAVGLGMVGMRPVAEIMYIDFVPLALDQIGNQAAKNRYMFGGKAKIPMVIRTTIGGGKGYAGQHSQSLEAILTHFPGLKVVAPSSPAEAKGLLKSAIRDNDPVVFIEHQLLYTEKGPVPEGEFLIPIGPARIAREGRDVTVVAYSLMVQRALRAAERAAQDGISVEVVDARTLVPLDEATIIRSVEKTGRALCVCQAPLTGCFAEHIAYKVQERCFGVLKSPVGILAAYDVPPPMAASLENENIPSAARIHDRIRALMGTAPGSRR